MLKAMTSGVPSSMQRPGDLRGQWRAPGQADARRIPDWLRQLVWWMDSAFRVPGTEVRVGLDPILGFLLPGLGDVLGSLPALLLVSLAMRQGVPTVVVFRMLLNIALDSLVGAVPFLGDAFDGMFRANQKNLELLERYAGDPRPGRARDYLVVGLALVLAAACVLLPIALVIALVKAIAG